LHGLSDNRETCWLRPDRRIDPARFAFGEVKSKEKKMKPVLRSTALAIGLASLLAVAPAAAAESDFLSRFEGTFSGGGKVSRNESESPTKVSCTMNANASANSLSMSGTCRAAVIFSRRISADLKVDGSGRYTGTYVGSSIGPARLSGKRSGDAVNLTITWPKPVRGDTTAYMTIRNAGNGKLAIIVTDEVSAGGPRQQVSSLSLSAS